MVLTNWPQTPTYFSFSHRDSQTIVHAAHVPDCLCAVSPTIRLDVPVAMPIRPLIVSPNLSLRVRIPYDAFRSESVSKLSCGDFCWSSLAVRSVHRFDPIRLELFSMMMRTRFRGTYHFLPLFSFVTVLRRHSIGMNWIKRRFYTDWQPIILTVFFDVTESFLLCGRKPGPGGRFFCTQQLTPGLKCNSTWKRSSDVGSFVGSSYSIITICDM